MSYNSSLISLKFRNTSMPYLHNMKNIQLIGEDRVLMINGSFVLPFYELTAENTFWSDSPVVSQQEFVEFVAKFKNGNVMLTL